MPQRTPLVLVGGQIQQLQAADSLAKTSLAIANKTAAYTVVAGDNGTYIRTTTGTGAITLPSCATVGAGFNFYYTNASTGTVTINRVGTDTFSTGTDTALQIGVGDTVQLVADDASASGKWRVLESAGTGQASNSTAFGKSSTGLPSVAVTGAGAMALGGSYASGTDSFAAANNDNTGTYGAQGSYSIAIGTRAKASGSTGIAIGYATDATSGVAIGSGAHSTGLGAVAVGNGTNATASATYSVAIGNGASASILGKFAYACGNLNANGDAQIARLVLRQSATVASTNYVLTSDAGAASSINQVVVPASSSFAFAGEITARQQAAGGTNSMGWKVEGIARREATGNIVLVASTVTALGGATAPTGWTLTCTADVTNQAIALTFNMGATVMNVRVVANIRTTELTYA